MIYNQIMTWKAFIILGMFSFEIESYIYETDFTLGSVKNITFKSSYNWFKIDILRLLPFLAMFIVISTTIHIHNIKLNYVQNAFWQSETKKIQTYNVKVCSLSQ